MRVIVRSSIPNCNKAFIMTKWNAVFNFDQKVATCNTYGSMSQSEMQVCSRSCASAVQLILFKCWGHVPNSLLWDAMFREYSSPHPSPFSALVIWSMLNSGSRIPTSLSCWPLSTGRICRLPRKCVGTTSRRYRNQLEVCLFRMDQEAIAALVSAKVQHGPRNVTSPWRVNDITRSNAREFGHMTYHIIVSIPLSDIGTSTAENPSIHLKYSMPAGFVLANSIR